MKIEGVEVHEYQVVRLDSFEPVNKGVLVSANDETGVVQWQQAGAVQSVVLGKNAIRILRKSNYGR